MDENVGSPDDDAPPPRENDALFDEPATPGREASTLSSLAGHLFGLQRRDALVIRRTFLLLTPALLPLAALNACGGAIAPSNEADAGPQQVITPVAEAGAIACLASSCAAQWLYQ